MYTAEKYVSAAPGMHMETWKQGSEGCVCVVFVNVQGVGLCVERTQGGRRKCECGCRRGYGDVEGETHRNEGGVREICVHMGYGCGADRGIWYVAMCAGNTVCVECLWSGEGTCVCERQPVDVDMGVYTSTGICVYFWGE